MTARTDTAAERAAHVARLAGQLVRRIRDESTDGVGLSLTQEWAISLLADSSGLTSAELARAQSVSPQTMSTAVSALSRAGYLSAGSDETDGRRKILHATAKGLDAVAQTRAVKQAWLQETLAGFSEEELRELDRGLALLDRIVER